MKHSIGRHWLALSVVVAVAAAVAACGQVTNSDMDAQAPTLRNVARGPAQLVQADFCDDAETGCAPTGAHGALAVNFVTGHAGFECKECHYVGGRLAFKPASMGGLAFLPPPAPRPYFDASSKTCSNVACHMVPAGSYSYWFPGGDGEPAYNTVTYGSTSPQPTPSWYTTGGAGCIGCHGNPPVNYSWHGSHGGGNQCELCHSDATSNGTTATGLFQGWCSTRAVNYGFVVGQPGTPQPANSVRCSTLHANGSLNVTARFESSCFGCH